MVSAGPSSIPRPCLHFALSRKVRRTIAGGKDGIISAVSYSEAIANSSDRGDPIGNCDEGRLPDSSHHHAVRRRARNCRGIVCAATRIMNVSFAIVACLATGAAGLPVLPPIANGKRSSAA